jgi:uncharacterized protein (DUF302 family)
MGELGTMPQSKRAEGAANGSLQAMESAPAVAKGFRGVRVQISTSLPFDEVLARLRVLMGNTSIPDLVRLATETSSQEEYAREVTKRYVGESGFMLFGEIDHGGWISKFGINRRIIRLILGNPLIAITMIRHDITAGLFAPVELLVTENEDGPGAVMTYVRPSSLMVIEENPPLLAAAEALDQKFVALVVRAADASP